jgi:hypothetical protein
VQCLLDMRQGRVHDQLIKDQEAKPLVQAAFSPMDRVGFRMLGIKQVMILRAASAKHLPGAAATANAG